MSHRKNEEDKSLPMYLVKVKERYGNNSGGYAVVNHPSIPNKYFTSKQLSMEEKYKRAFDHLQSAIPNYE